MSRFDVILDSSAPATDQRPIHGDMVPPVGEDFDFVVIADRTGGAAYQMFEKGLDVAASLRPNFILSVGDLVEGYWVDEAEADAEWDYIDGHLERMAIPVLLTVGNHDYGTPAMIEVWRRRKGADYYAVRYGPLLILVANSEARNNFTGFVPETLLRWNRYNIRHPRQHTAIADLVNRGREAVAEIYPDLFARNGDYIFEAWADPEEIGFIQDFDEKLMAMEEFRDPKNLVNPALSDEQLTFFGRVLGEHSDVAWTFLSLHQPAWKKSEWRFEQLEDMLSDRPYSVVAGHTHLLDVEVRNGRYYITMGKTGGCHCFNGDGDIHHVLLVRVRNGVPAFEVVRYDDHIERLPLSAFIAT